MPVRSWRMEPVNLPTDRRDGAGPDTGEAATEVGLVVDLTDAATREVLETYIPLIQQGRGAEVLELPA